MKCVRDKKPAAIGCHQPVANAVQINSGTFAKVTNVNWRSNRRGAAQCPAAYCPTHPINKTNEAK